MDFRLFSKRLVIAGTGIIWLIKYLLRPNFIFPEPVSFFWGIAPNLLGSFLLPFGACWLFQGKHFRRVKWCRVENSTQLRQFCGSAFFLLLVNEYLQQIRFFGRTFDYFDILFSGLGLVLAYSVVNRRLEPQYKAAV